MILVKPDQAADKIGSVYVPQGSIQGPDRPGDSRDTGIGTVVAIGPGDKHKEFDFDKCWWCNGPRAHDRTAIPVTTYTCRCGTFTWSQLLDMAAEWMDEGERHPMCTKVGDRVVFPRRPSSPGGEFSCVIEGETYMMFNEEQSCLAVIEA